MQEIIFLIKNISYQKLSFKNENKGKDKNDNMISGITR